MKHLKLFAIAILILASTHISAQTSRLYTSAEGLANSHINDIFQDSKGFIWISTENGLSRFDGLKFSTFRSEPSKNDAIVSNTVRTVFEDGNGLLWIGTSAGLQIFETKYGIFSKVNMEDWSAPDSDQHITSITGIEIGGTAKIIAASSGHGIYVLDEASRKIDHSIQNAANMAIQEKFISGIYQDSRSRLWITKENGGLTVFDTESLKEATDIWETGMSEISKDTFNSIIEEESTGNIYIGSTNHGILIWESSTGKIRKTVEKYGYSIMSMTRNNVVSRYGRRSFIVGTENKGLKIFDAEKETISDLRTASLTFETEGWKIHELMEDNQGNIWVGAYQRGLMIIPRSMFGFRNVDFNEYGKGDRGSISVTSIISDEERDCLWIGTDGGGIFKSDQYGTKENICADNSRLTNNSIMSLSLDKRGTLWIATYLGGIFTYSPEKGVRPFKDQQTINNDKIYNLYYDNEADIMYAGTHGSGFALIDAKVERVQRIWDDEDAYKWISYLTMDRSGLLWIGTYNGPMAYDGKTGKLTKYELVKDKSVRINSIFESMDGNIWIGTDEGLIRIDRATKEKKFYTEADGLASNSVSGIMEDNEGYLWISTLYGLSRMHLESETFKNFYRHDGLQENEFNARSAFKSSDGRMFFGGINGLTTFNPSYVDRGERQIPPLYLSNLNVMNTDIRYDACNGDDNILDKHIAEAEKITLPHNADVFSLEFSVLEYTNPQKISYEYILEGFERKWNKALPGSHAATYTNVPSGRYNLKIKAYYEGKPEAFSYREIAVHISPAWYLSVWACIVYIITAALVIIAAINDIKRKAALKKQQEESEMKEMKLEMFTNISHEIRTPLTLVMSPLKKLREDEKNPESKELYNLMYRNSLRILRMVNQLMDIRKVDNGQMKLHFLETEVVFFTKDIMQSFENLAASRNINFEIESRQETMHLWIDQDNFDKILFNILSNAFKYTPEKGTVKISISDAVPNSGTLPQNIEKYVEFIIENSGEPIEEKHLDKIFDRFYQVGMKDAKIGSGVGLNLAKMLVDLHHGEISVHNTESGVAFRIRIPVGCAHLTVGEMTKPENHKDLYTRSTEPFIAEHTGKEDVTHEIINEEEQSSKNLKKKTIMLVDDDSEMRAYLKLELQNIYNVEVCANGKEAWSKISTVIPDAVITDLVMDKMDGAELCEKIKKHPGTNHIPVILLTSATDDQSQHRCIESGADRFFTKPVSLETLKSAVASAIATREMIRNKYSRSIDYGYDTMTINNPDNILISKVISVIRKNIENPDFSVEELSREIGMSRVHLNRKLKENMNISPSNLIKSIRLKQAAYLLINNKVNISEVAYKVGFSTHSYFSNSFHDYFGMTPKEFMNQYMNCTDEETLKRLLS